MTGKHDHRCIEELITAALQLDLLNDPAASVCNMLDLDPRLTLGELRRAFPTRTWVATHDERMLQMAAHVDSMIAALPPGEMFTPEYTARRNAEIAIDRAIGTERPTTRRRWWRAD